MRVPLSCGIYANLIGIYAPTMICTDEKKETFYDELKCHVRKVPVAGKVFFPGDFNARVVRDCEEWKILAKHGVGKWSINGPVTLKLPVHAQMYGKTRTAIS